MKPEKAQYLRIGNPVNVDLNVYAQISLVPGVITSAHPLGQSTRRVRIDVAAPTWLIAGQGKKSANMSLAEMAYRVSSSGFDVSLAHPATDDPDQDSRRSVLDVYIPNGVPLKTALAELSQAMDSNGTGIPIKQDDLLSHINKPVTASTLLGRIRTLTGAQDETFFVDARTVNLAIQGQHPSQQTSRA